MDVRTSLKLWSSTLLPQTEGINLQREVIGKELTRELTAQQRQAAQPYEQQR